MKRRRCRTSGGRCRATTGPSVSVLHPAVLVGGAAADRRPLAGLPQLEDDGDAFRRLAARDVEHVCRDHEVSGSCSSSFVSRSRVIFRCSSAAIRSSSPGSMPQPALEQGQHLVAGLAGRADDENVAEAGLVVAVGLGQPPQRLRRPAPRRQPAPRPTRPSSPARRPALTRLPTRRCPPRSSDAPRTPRASRRRRAPTRSRRRASPAPSTLGERPRRRHLPRPARRAAAAQERARGRRFDASQRIQRQSSRMLSGVPASLRGFFFIVASRTAAAARCRRRERY